MNLDILFGLMKRSSHNQDADHSEWIAAGLPININDGLPDCTSLPVFGGIEPKNTAGIWSWDDTRLIVGSCADDIEIIDR